MTDIQVRSEKEIRREKLTDLQAFQAALNREPNPAEIQVNVHAGGAKYLPISFIEMTLDEMFFGLWKIENFQTRTIGNEIVGSLDLSVFHPIKEVWITRTGAAATMVRMQKGAGISEIDKKIHNALEMDYPHLKADCLRNAAASLGKIFGRDLNRKFVDTYKALISQQVVANGAITSHVDKTSYEDQRRSKLLGLLEQARIQNDKLEASFRLRISEAESDAEFGQLGHEIKMHIPDDNPASQFESRSKIQ